MRWERGRILGDRIRQSWKARLGLSACAAALACAGALYLYFMGPGNIPLICVFHEVTGLYCPGCGAGRACYSILHGQFLEAFCYNPLMTVLLPLIGLYIAARMVDWVVTGGNHIDRKINVKFLTWVLVIVVVYGVLRNIPVFPFTLLAPEGLWQIL
ncbi:MAG TPA: DUF2752 domain-containing protein [Candidatus Mediterraneibacter caccavium]|uniref:DUF2752 domain-containing protein n=1 Tax=Candidatus Mediterraneibacter caccavium TaxID=2838661 RepID=A0A9D2ASR9_9FIRM|nr:DUF2752 domain-containing protein [Lachnoclostridium sp. An76]HIX48563.1 DUF2752 domain-containing protein [Candidatus Mediterraneibacter caccavium]